MREYIIQAAEWTIDCNGDSLFKNAEEIVRCKDCKHYIAPGTLHFDGGRTNLAACTIVRAYVVKITPNDFCAWGEKKENTND